ncbi:MAG TPA: amylo-alpha-1,6-glucosidase [Kofleriaceae bacterium]|nr:amylo-alpha-1,6-glucosidase [Kofleriaceae bacterium]
MTDPREWLEADGTGGFAMGTADGIRTRRYHAVLLVATRPPEGRIALVSDLEVYVETARGRWALSSHRYAGDVVHPDGANRIARFDHAPWPRWEWQLPDGTRIAGELVAIHRAPRVALRWTRLAGEGAARLIVRPLISARDYHSLARENASLRFDAEAGGERVTWRPYHGVPAIAALANARYDHAPTWYRSFVYAEDRARGLDHEEDLAAPGSFAFDLAAAPARLALAAQAGLDGERAADYVDRAFAAERARRAAFATPLHRAADAYLVTRGLGRTVIAGYPWFADWGRDTFVSLRGLCLATGRRDDAREILVQWAGAVDQGMLPNRYSEVDEAPEYNSADGALWFTIAADAYLAGDVAPGVRATLEAAIAAAIEGHARGTRHRIAADRDGLLACGEPGVQLTWMDAKVDGDVITPRIGKPVEIQALWLNALAIAGRRDARWRELFERGRAAFAERFWNAERGQLYDVIDCDHVAGKLDGACRPNQILAIGGLPLAVIDGERARAVVDAVERQLVTPAGLRSLATDEPGYRGRYIGGRVLRDRAYHNGTVWPWLAGPFVEAWLRVRGDTAAARREARARFVAPLHARLELCGLGHLSEICDGDPPWRPVGCPFQAWSMAELLRIDALTA